MDSVVFAPSFPPKKSPTTQTNQIRSSHRNPHEQPVRRESEKTATVFHRKVTEGFETSAFIPSYFFAIYKPLYLWHRPSPHYS